MRTRLLTAVAALLVALGATLTLSSPALAAASGCAVDGAYGGQYDTCYLTHGSGYYLYYVNVKAESPASGQPVNFASFAGCGVHAQLYNNYSGGNHRNWDSPRYSCGEFAAGGYSINVPVYAYVPGGQYCVRLWVDNNNSYFASAHAACFNVHG
jgi:hypothetical protein